MARATAVTKRGVVDGLGERTVTADAAGVAETLVVRSELVAVAGFEKAVAARAQVVQSLSHRSLARVLRVDTAPGGLSVQSESALEAERLDHLIARRTAAGRPLSIEHAAYVASEAVSALRALHAAGAGVCHGVVSASRFLLTVDDRVLLHDAVFAGALGLLQWTPEQVLEHLDVRVPVLPGIPAFTPLTDQLQLGLVLLHMVTGEHQQHRPPDQLREVLAGATTPSVDGEYAPLPPAFHALLARMLLLSADGPFRSFVAVERALNAWLAGEPGVRPRLPAIAFDHDTEAAPGAVESVAPVLTVVRNDASEAREAEGGGADPVPAWYQGAPSVAAIATHAAVAPALAYETSPSPVLGVVPAVEAPVADLLPAERDRFGVGPAPVPATPPSLPPVAPAVVARPGGTATRPNSIFEPVPEADGPLFEDDFAAPTLRRPAEEIFSPSTEPKSRPGVRMAIVAAAALLVLGGLGYFVVGYLLPATAVVPKGQLQLESKPTGATIYVAGTERGKTPLSLTLPEGSYRVEFTLGDETKVVTVAVAADKSAYQQVSLYPPGPPGSLTVTSNPPGARVSVDGQPLGRAPATLGEVVPGEHQVVVESAVARTERTVEVLAGASVKVEVPLSGYIEVETPFEVAVFDGAKLQGSTRGGRFAVPAGKRQLTFANNELQYEENREVEVLAGAVTAVALTPPPAILNFTADPPSEVFVDGRPMGTTPLRNVRVSLGTHIVRFVHPTHGEQQDTILVSLGPPGRLHANMQSKKVTGKRPAVPGRR